MYIIIAILIFGILIATHELGHFLVAKACGVKVLEYSIGMGPAILKKQGRETLYSLRLLPIGGYCSMEGEDEDSEDPRAFSNQAAWKRFLILVAGAAMNFIVGFILILLVFSQASAFSTPTITGFMDGCPYEGEQGFMEGDTIYKINGHRIYFSTNVSTYLSRSGETVDIVLIRDGEKVKLDDYELKTLEYEVNGETLIRYGFYFGVEETGLGAYLRYSWYSAIDFVRLVWLSLSDLVTGAVSVKEVSGVVGIVDMINDVGRESGSFYDAMLNIGYLGAFIAINLAVMNLLPIPALDGGRVLFLIVNAVAQFIFRRRIDSKYEGYVHAAGLVLLLGFMAYVMYNDIVRLIAG